MNRKQLYMVIALLSIGSFVLFRPVLAEEKPSVEQRIANLEQRLSIVSRQNAELEQQLNIVKRQYDIDKEESSKKAKDAPVIKASAKDGFSIKAADESFKLKLSGYAQADTRIFIDRNKPESQLTNTFFVRTARLTTSGTIGQWGEFFISPEFGGTSGVNLPDAYVGLKLWPVFNIRGGKFKAPFGLERLQSTPNLTFAELALPSNLGPNRDVGFALFGDFFKNTVNYSIGVFNGVQDGATSVTDTNNDKDLVARVFTQAFRNSDVLSLRGLGIGGAVTYGRRKDSKLDLKYKTFGQETFFSYGSGVSADGAQVRYSPQVYYYNKSFGLLSEYIISEAKFAKTIGGVIKRNKFQNDSWQVAASYVLTGEDASYKGVIPLHPFSIKDSQWGGFEVKARYNTLNVDDKAFSSDFAKLATSASEADAWGTGLNWYLNRNIRYVSDYEQTRFKGGAKNNGDRATEHLVLSRIQFQF